LLRLHGPPWWLPPGHFFSFFISKKARGVLPRVSFFIDGFNFYHSLNDPKYFRHPLYPKGTPKYRKYLWLDYFKFLTQHYLPEQGTTSDIFYFSAYAHHRSKRSVRTHQLLVEAWESTGITAVLGNFKQKHRFCTNCHKYVKAHEEKETDVNIAIYLLNEAYKNTYDIAILVTNDTDLVPAITMLKNTHPQKEIGVLFPLDRSSADLKRVSDFVKYTDKKHLGRCQFPDTITLPSGYKFSKPAKYV
jgi:uncharacterized LabA/DUF88 family protein